MWQYINTMAWMSSRARDRGWTSRVGAFGEAADRAVRLQEKGRIDRPAGCRKLESLCPARLCWSGAVECAGVAEWQTRWTQNPVYASRCGFKSHLRQFLT